MYIIELKNGCLSERMDIVLRGFYTAASGMIAQQRRTEMLTNNMSNANTPGYKADQSSLRSFPEMLLSRLESKEVATKNGLTLPTSNLVGAINTGVYTQEIASTFAQGTLQETGISTDLALTDISMPLNDENGQPTSIFFTVRRPDGETVYTRNGNFTIDQEGYLTTSNGHYVLDIAGNAIQVDNDQFSVDQTGVIRTSTGDSITQIGIAYATNPLALEKGADGSYAYLGDGGLPLVSDQVIPGVQYSLQQGFVEGSNVDSSKTMTEMLTAYRAFEANQKILQAYDKSLEKAVTEIGRV